MANFKVLTHLTHDGTAYPVGSEVEMTAAAAKPLIRDGILEDPNAEKPTPTPVVRTPKADKKAKGDKKDEGKGDEKKEDDADTGEGGEGESSTTGEGEGDGQGDGSDKKDDADNL